ncbi:hypothetical protein CEXT_745541, partial [Caerostris extrusa]
MGIRDPTTAKIGEEIFPFEIEIVPEYFLKKAEEELHDTAERRAQGLQEIKELVKNDEHTKNIEFDDDFLLQYLRLRHNSSGGKSQIYISAPLRCQDGCTILLVELDNWVPEKFPVDEVKRVYLLYLLDSLRNPMTQINGFKIIYDLKSNPLRHLRHLTPENLYLLYHGSQAKIVKDSGTAFAADDRCGPINYLLNTMFFHVTSQSTTDISVWKAVSLQNLLKPPQT